MTLRRTVCGATFNWPCRPAARWPTSREPTFPEARSLRSIAATVRQKAYDVVICDLKMPRVDGMTLYRAVAAATPALARRVIFVTGDVAGTDAERFLEDSGCRWLAKPFRLGDLLRAVRDTIG